MIDRDRFFARARVKLFNGTLDQRQVDGINAVLAEWEHRQLTDLRHLAYILATDKWETATTMQPINEFGGDAYFKRMYDIEGQRPGVARLLGNLFPGDGALFHGRGLVQLTGRKNYEHMTKLVTMARWVIDLEKEPDQALRMDVAVAVTFEGMLRAESSFGDFTGVALENFFNATTDDPLGARAIINGQDHAPQIAEIYDGFVEALS